MPKEWLYKAILITWNDEKSIHIYYDENESMISIVTASVTKQKYRWNKYMK